MDLFDGRHSILVAAFLEVLSELSEEQVASAASAFDDEVARLDRDALHRATDVGRLAEVTHAREDAVATLAGSPRSSAAAAAVTAVALRDVLSAGVLEKLYAPYQLLIPWDPTVEPPQTADRPSLWRRRSTIAAFLLALGSVATATSIAFAYLSLSHPKLTGGGAEVDLVVDPNASSLNDTQSVQATVVRIAKRRLAAAGVSSWSVTPVGGAIVRINAVNTTPLQARDLFGPKGLVRWMTWKSASRAPDGRLAIPTDSDGSAVVDKSNVPVEEGGACQGVGIDPECIPVGYLPESAGVDGSMVSNATVGMDSANHVATVQFTLNGIGTTRLAAVTSGLVAKSAPENKLAIFVDNRMINDAIVLAALDTGTTAISGGVITTDPLYRKNLTIWLKAGQYPHSTRLVSVKAVAGRPELAAGVVPSLAALTLGLLVTAAATLWMLRLRRASHTEAPRLTERKP